MHRKALTQLLHTYREQYPDETQTTDRYLDFVSAHQDCFERSLSVGHVTGSAWLLNQAGTQVLLTHHRKLDIWVQLGGHADGNTDVTAVALKEAREESGIADIAVVSDTLFDIDIHLIPERKSEPAHYHYDARFLLQTLSTDEFVVSDESHALEWVDVARIEERTTEASMTRMAQKYLCLNANR